MKLLFRKYKEVLTPAQKKEANRNRLIAILAGLLIGLSYPPLPFPFLIFFGFTPYFFLLEKKESLEEINRLAYLANFTFTIITLYWVGSWTEEADPFLMISGLLLMFVNPALYLIPTTLYYISRKSFGRMGALFLFPFYWVTFEFLYSLTDLRFPWLTLANSLTYFNTFIQIADLIGAYGISTLILFINLFFYLSFIKADRIKKINAAYALWAILIFSFVILYGIYRLHNYTNSGLRIKVGLVQPNLNPWDKWEAGNLDEQLEQYLNMSRQAADRNAKLIVWPESALPVYFLSGNYPAEVEKLHRFVDSANVFVMTGMPDATFFFDESEAPPDAKTTKASGVKYVSYNSILLFAPNTREVQKYGKIKLVPFGERVPFLEQLPFLGDLIKWQVGISSWNVGREQKVFWIMKDEKGNDLLNAAGVICIESIYPDFVAGFVESGANLIVVVTNDSWYGYSSGPFQHKEISALRAIENRRTVIRAANGGISCIIDPLGRTIAQTSLFTKDLLTGYAELRYEKTFYTKYPLLFPIFAAVISVCTIIFFCAKTIQLKFHKRNEKNN